MIAIHQPNFIPWIGYFHKISQVDEFVFLDDVIYSASGGMYPRRTKITSNSGPKWLAAPIANLRYSNQKKINLLELDSRQNLVGVLGKGLDDSYKQHSHFEEIYDFMMEIAASAEKNLSSFNINVIKKITNLVVSKPVKFTLSSNLRIDSKGTDRLIEIAKSLDADVYLSGSGSSGYLSESEFIRSGIELRVQESLPYNYPQRNTNEFIKGLSILDPLMNLGFTGTRELLRKC